MFLIDENPDGRLLSQRANVTGIDPNRDYFVQAQPEQQNDVGGPCSSICPPSALEGHGYENPTLTDGDTIPHNPGIDEDIFEHWNVQRVEQERADFAADGLGAALTTIQSPIRDWNETGGTSTHNYTIAAAGVPGLSDDRRRHGDRHHHHHHLPHRAGRQGGHQRQRRRLQRHLHGDLAESL